MAARKANFTQTYEHVWINGPTDLSMVQFTIPDLVSIDNLFENFIFWDNLASDCEILSTGYSRTFLADGKEIIEDGEHQMICLTSDDRLEELINVVTTKVMSSKVDLITTTPITGNKNYFEYINV